MFDAAKRAMGEFRDDVTTRMWRSTRDDEVDGGHVYGFTTFCWDLLYRVITSAYDFLWRPLYKVRYCD